MDERGVVLLDVWRHIELQLRYLRAVRIENGTVDDRSHMEDDIVVVAAVIVVMAKPVARAQVYLHIAHPQRAANLDRRRDEVGSGVRIVHARVEHLHTLSVGGQERAEGKGLVLPCIMKEMFHFDRFKALTGLFRDNYHPVFDDFSSKVKIIISKCLTLQSFFVK